MNRLVPSLLALVALLAASPAVAESDSESSDDTGASSSTVVSRGDTTWRLHARLRPRLEGRWNHWFDLRPDQLNYVKPDQTDVFTNQTRLGAGLEVGDLTADVLLQHAAIWGTTGGDALTDPSIGVHRASFTWQPVEVWSLELGRFALAYGDERVLGAVGWSQVGRSWDGLRTVITPIDGLDFDVFGARYTEGASVRLEGFRGGFFEDDAFLTGMYASASEDLLGLLQAADLYALYDVRFDRPASEGPLRRGLATIGSRLDGRWKPVDANLEGAYQFGDRCVPAALEGNCSDETIAVSGWFVDSEVGLSFDLPPKLRAFAGYSRASGDDPDSSEDEAYRQLYPTGHKWLGWTDIIGPRTNLQELRGGLELGVGPVQIVEKYHHFTRLEPETAPAGMEFDTTVGLAAGEHVDMKVGHGLFIPDSGMSSGDASPEGVAHWAFLQFVASM